MADTNPADAPYPLWSATANYPLGYKVVENGEIYQAKWYNSGDDPSAQVQYSWQTPWELLGPVLPGDHARGRSPRCPRAPTRRGRSSTQYQAGNKVLYQGLPYQAKWSNQGVSPATASTDPAGRRGRRCTASLASQAARAVAAAGGSSSPSASSSPGHDG